MSSTPESTSTFAVEQNGINVIHESERKGKAADLFWPWFAANVSVLGISYGSWVLGFGLSWGQALLVSLAGVIISFLLVGLVSISGKRGSAPTMIVSRAAFGVHGNAIPAGLSYLLLIGWETILCALAVLATSTVFGRLGWGGGTTTQVLGFVVVAAVIVLSGALGFDTIMKVQTWLTIATGVLTVAYMLLTFDHIDMSAVTAMPSGGFTSVLGALVFMMTGFGLGWVNSGGDYARYLPRSTSGAAVAAWTTIGSSAAPLILITYGILLAGSDPDLSAAIGMDPIGALTTALPTWFLLPFAIVAIGGLIGGAVLDIYSSGLALLTLGLKVPRWVAATIDGVVMALGTVYIVWVADDFLGPFMGFLITLGVPIAAWCGVFLADLLLRKQPYAEADLFDPRGRYGAVGVPAVAATIIGAVVGWGLVTNTYASWLSWQGYLLGPLGGKSGDWAYANLGVLAALVLGFGIYLVAGGGGIRRQESV